MTKDEKKGEDKNDSSGDKKTKDLDPSPFIPKEMELKMNPPKRQRIGLDKPRLVKKMRTPINTH